MSFAGGSEKLETLFLYDFQKEVSVRACSGENDVIILPTGTGKTYVALKIIMDRLEVHMKQKSK